MRHCLFALALTAILTADAAAQESISLPRPGPEHETLAKDVGTWDATIELVMQPGGTPVVSRGVETNTLLGGLWLVSDFKGEMFGMPYQGHVVTGFDRAKKKYVGTWVDSMSPGLTAVEGTIDPKTKIMNSVVEGPCPDGSNMKAKTTSERQGDDTRVFTMYSPEDKGESFAMMKITYKRRR